MSKKERLDLSKIAENTINFFNTANIVFENQQSHVTYMLTRSNHPHTKQPIKQRR